jgi:hypothetical protein
MQMSAWADEILGLTTMDEGCIVQSPLKINRDLDARGDGDAQQMARSTIQSSETFGRLIASIILG